MKLIPFDPTRYIETPEDAATYLSIALEEDEAGVRDALHVVGRALGDADLAERMRGEGALGLGKVMEAVQSLGLRLVVEADG